MPLYKKTIHELKDLLAKKEVSAIDIFNDFEKRINKVENKVNSFLTLNLAEAKQLAIKADEKIQKGKELLPLEGIPYALKDNIITKDIKTTCSSKLLENFIPPYNSTVYNKLKESGAILFGKVDMDEFAMGSSNENSSFNKVRNPYDFQRVPGGSSGASVTSVASDEVAFALGSDTGGSIRMPASYCNVTGLKPTYGRVSRYGLVAFGSSLDQIGPITKDVRDSAIVLNAISGYDKKDSTSINKATPDYESFLTKSLKGITVGLDLSLLESEGLDDEIKKKVLEAKDIFKDLGANIKEISSHYNDYAIATYYLISSSEASSNLSRFDGIRYGVRKDGKDIEEIMLNSRSEGFGDEVKRRIMLGTYALSSGYYDMYYSKALKVRNLIKQDYDNIFKECDVILSPTTPTTNFILVVPLIASSNISETPLV